jgi:hypothetical protein
MTTGSDLAIDIEQILPLIVCVHPRSGTTLLNRLLNTHPEIFMTFELGVFWELDVPFERYRKRLRTSWQRRRIVSKPGRRGKIRSRLRSRRFLQSYLGFLKREARRLVSLESVVTGLHAWFPAARVVGDKKPSYIFRLDRLPAPDKLRRIIILRDPRDVARSALEMATTRWDKEKNAVRYGSSQKIARSWVRAVESMERNAEGSHIVRYEQLIAEPERELGTIGGYLDVDPGRFNARIIRKDSVGKYRRGLSAQDLGTVLDIAGPSMKRLGYTP